MPDLISLLPPNATPVEQVLEQVLAAPLVIPVKVETNWSAADCPINVLPFLAWGWSIDFWRTDWSDDRKRGLTAAAPELHRSKGTRAGITNALSALGFPDTLVQAWYEYPEGDGNPFHFRVDVEVAEFGISDSEFETVVRAVETSKSARDTLDRLRLVLTARHAPSAVAAVSSGELINILPYQPDDIFSAGAPGPVAWMSLGETLYLEAA